MKTSKSHFFRILYQFTVVWIGFAFVFNTVLPAAYAQSVSTLPVPGTQVSLSPAFHPLVLRALKVQPDHPFQFEFIIDQGDTQFSDEEFRSESQKLIRYFLASLTIPENDLWVNLSPYEKDRIIPESFGVTEMGRDLLAQDYILKQITATLMYPEKEVGKKFWDKVHQQAFEKFGTTDIPTNTFNKVWIVPQKAVVYENGPTAYVDETKLKVMLEEDYVALANQKGSAESQATAKDVALANQKESTKRPRGGVLGTSSDIASSVVREIILPELEKEVNYGTHFASLRQVYNSLILANWYKKRMKDSLLSQVYTDKNKVSGVDIDDKAEAKKIYARYVEAFQRGVYNYIKEDYDPVHEESIPRKYFAGGVNLMGMVTSSAVMDIKTGLPKERLPDFKDFKNVFVNVKPFENIPTQESSIAENWASFSKVTKDKSLLKRLTELEKMITIESDSADMTVQSIQGEAPQVQTIVLDANPIDLLKEVTFYLEDLQAQRQGASPNHIFPVEYRQTQQVLRKVLAVSLPWYQLNVGRVTQGLKRTQEYGLSRFMEGAAVEIDTAALRQVIRNLEQQGKESSNTIVISFRDSLLKELRAENNQRIIAAIKAEEKESGQVLSIRLFPLDRQRLTAIAANQMFPRGSVSLDRILAPLGMTWEELLDNELELYSAIRREERIEDALNNDLEKLAEALVRFREDKELDLESMAKAAGIFVNVYHQYEAGSIRQINPKHILAFAKGLDVSPNELWPANDLVEIQLKSPRENKSTFPVENDQSVKLPNNDQANQDLLPAGNVGKNVINLGESQSSETNEINNDKVGGINLSADQTNLEIRSNGAPVEFNFTPDQIQNMKIDGFVPVIINITPVTNLPMFLTGKMDPSLTNGISQIN